MPFITILGVSYDLENAAMLLRLSMRSAIADIPELELKAEQISIFTAAEQYPPSALIAKVEGLFDTPKRSADVRNELAKRIGEFLEQFARKYLPLCDVVEVFVASPFQPENGFYTVQTRKER